MKDRIKQYIDHKGITAGELSVMLDVQRSNISHILNGRNKPGAAFIEKLLLTFPDLNARWLLTGEGNMMEDTSTSLTTQKNELLSNTPREVKAKIKHGLDDKVHEASNVAITKPVDELEKMILLFNDGTFTTYKSRNKD